MKIKYLPIIALLLLGGGCVDITYDENGCAEYEDGCKAVFECLDKGGTPTTRSRTGGAMVLDTCQFPNQ